MQGALAPAMPQQTRICANFFLQVDEEHAAAAAAAAAAKRHAQDELAAHALKTAGIARSLDTCLRGSSLHL